MKPTSTLRLAVRARAVIAAAATCSCTALAQTAPPAPPSLPSAAERAGVAALGCLIQPSAVADVGSPVVGVLAEVFADRGDTVRRGQLLARHDAQVERAALALAQARVQTDADLRAAQSQSDFAQRKAERAAELTDLKFVSTQARDQADAEAHIAAMRLAQAQEQRELAARELQLARAQMALRNVTSPLDGVVVERYASAGERVENKPIFRIAQIDPLRVEVVLPAGLFGQVRQGTVAEVMPELAGAAPVQAAVTVVDRVIDPASNTFRVRLSMPNREQSLPSGVRCRVEFKP